MKDIGIGDEVLATDPETGENGPRPVTALIKGTGDKQLVDITLGTGTSHTLTATDGHPFWVPTLNRWIQADQLTAGQWLQTSTGTWVQITAVTLRITSTTVHNLTVADLHTYYVMAGKTPVLVHNCSPSTVQSRMYVGGRPGTDGTPQAPLPKGTVVTRGGNLQDGNYHYVVMPGGSVRAFHESVFDGGVWAGHTSLSGGRPVTMAGTFDVSSGSITEFGNFSGHYRPNGSGMESVARDALNGNGFNVGGARWDPFNFG
ncbi:HINT domain-containing protein [Streptomyces anulatus]